MIQKLLKRWPQAFTSLVLLLTLGLGGYSVHRIILNDQLNTAARAGDLPSVRSLLRRGADIEGCSIHFKTPLMSAAEGGNGNVILLLLAHGADANAHNGSGSVLMWAVASGNVGVVRTLLFRGADVNWHSEAGDTALQMAKEYKQPVIAKMLQSTGARS